MIHRKKHHYRPRLALLAGALCAFSTSAGAATTLTFTPSSLSFPVTTTGSTSAAEAVTVANTGTTAASITSITIAGLNPSDFAISAKTCTTSLAAGAMCTVSVTFKPLANGIRAASLTFTDNATGSPQSVTLQGTAQSGKQGLAFYPTSLSFPVTTVGAISNALGTTLTNYGSASISITGVHLSGSNTADFAIVGNSCGTLVQGQACSVSVTFSPSAAGVRQTSLAFTDTSGGNPQTVPLVGTAQPATLSLSLPSSVSAGTEDVGETTAPISVNVSNNGTAPVTYSGATISGTNAADFAVNSGTNCTNGGTLAPNSFCVVEVTFKPSAAGLRTASLNIADSAAGSPQKITLYGVGQASTNTLSFSKGTIDLGVQPIGVTSGQMNVTAQNTGTNPVSFTSVTIAGLNAGDFTITSNGCGGTLNTSQSCTEYVNFTPSGAGERTASLKFTDSATGSPQTVALAGTGETQTENLSFNYLDYGFGPIVVGATSPQFNESVFNAGDVPVTFSTVAITGTNAADFTIFNEGCPIAPATLLVGQTCTVSIGFSPSAAGVRSAGLQFTDTGSGSPQTIGLGGLGEAQTQTLTFSAPNLIFPGVTVGSSGGSEGVSITNTGDQPVTFSAVTLTGSGASSFAISSNSCSFVYPGQGCSVSVYATPTSSGVQSAAISLTDGAVGSPQTLPIAVDGQPATPALFENPSDVNFGYGAVGATSAATLVTLTNNSASGVTVTYLAVGPNASDFVVTSNTCSGALAGSASCSLMVAFRPTALGPRTGALRFTVGGVAQEVLVAGVGTSTSQLLTLQTAADFGEAAVGSTSGQVSISIQNTGGIPVNITGYTVAGADPADFSVASNTCGPTLAPSVICSVAMVFTPTAGGERTATLQVADTATGSPQSVGLSGEGEADVIALTLPASFDLGSTVPGVPVSASLQLVNSGIGTVNVATTAITGANAADFSVTYNPCLTIGGDSSCYLQLSFNPTAAGVRTATLSLTDNTSGSPQTLTLVGVGEPSISTLSVPAALGFPLVNVGAYSLEYVTLQNAGTISVNVSSVAISGTNATDFTVYNACPSIPAGTACSLPVAFLPAAAGLRVANLTITDSATGSPQKVSLTGVGQAAVASLSIPQDLSFPTTTIGSYYEESFPIYNIGTAPIVFSNLAITGANPADFLIISSCPQLYPGGGCNVVVAFIPTAAGTRVATLQFTDNGTGSPQSVTLTGIGQGQTTTAALTPSSLTYSAQSVGTQSGGQNVYLTNYGDEPVTVSKVSIGGADPRDFQILSNSCEGYTLIQNGYCGVEIVFTPIAKGARTATVTAVDNAVGGSQSATLSGTGQ